jgi:hypothetical protein
MHGNTQRAVVGSRFHGMNVSYLDHREQSEKEQADKRHHRHSAKLCAESITKVTL